MKRAVFVLLLTVLLLCGCKADVPELTTVRYDYIYRTTENEEATSEKISEEITEETTEELSSSDVLTTIISIVQESTTVKTEAENTTAEEPASVKDENQTKEEESASVPTSSGEIDLSISMPEKNGTMVVDTSPDNKFITIVCTDRGIDVSLLAAVYAVPESGQNYVFEFESGKTRSVDSLRRVYLIDSNGSITGVAATESSEKENVSSVENWFCMNVLIKELIYPSVEKEIKG